MERNTHSPERCEHGISFSDRRCFNCFPRATPAQPLNPAPCIPPPPVGFTAQDKTEADAFANHRASKFTKAWHAARDGYLQGVIRERIRQTLGGELGNA